MAANIIGTYVIELDQGPGVEWPGWLLVVARRGSRGGLGDILSKRAQHLRAAE